MPWCEECSKYLTPSSLKEDGTCPQCGRPVAEHETSSTDEKSAAEKAPWHFKLMIVALIVYLVWRFIDLFS